MAMELMDRAIGKLHILLLLIVMGLLGGCAVMYSSDDVKGRIVDKATGEPIAGAVVVGIWQLESQGFEHSYGAAIHVVESVSDAQGNYRLKGFDTKWVGPFRGELRNSDPHISVFAEDYIPGNAGSGSLIPLKHSTGHHRVSPYNGRDIGLERGALDNQADEDNARVWGGDVRMLVDGGGCAVTTLSALRVLLEKLEPKYDKLYKAGYGFHKTPYKDAINLCKEEKNP